MEKEITINKNIIFSLIKSHMKLNQAEYNRNPKYNNTHFAYIAEEQIIKEFTRVNLLGELMEVI